MATTKATTVKSVTTKPYTASEIAMAKLFEPAKAAKMTAANTTAATKAAIAARATAAGKTPTASGIEATYKKNQAAAAAPKKAGSSVPPELAPKPMPIEAPERMRGGGNAGGSRGGGGGGASDATMTTPSGTSPSAGAPGRTRVPRPKKDEWSANAKGVRTKGSSSDKDVVGGVRKIGGRASAAGAKPVKKGPSATPPSNRYAPKETIAHPASVASTTTVAAPVVKKPWTPTIDFDQPFRPTPIQTPPPVIQESDYLASSPSRTANVVTNALSRKRQSPRSR